MKDGPFDERLMCSVNRLEYDFRTKVGIIEFVGADCCHMPAAVALFEAIDPGVLTVRTYNEQGADVMYCRGSVEREWGAHRGG